MPRPLLLAIGFLALALLVYGAELGNGFVRWDDGMLIYQNPAVMTMSWATAWRAFTTYDPELYIPLTLLSYQVDALLGGGGPFLFHLSNLLLHVLNALLVAWLAFLLLKRREIAVALGLLFLVHPLHVEAVAWASARKDVLSTAGFLASLIAYLHWRASGRRAHERWSLAFFFLGLLAKVMVLTLPLVLLLLDMREQGRITWRDLREKLPYFGLAAAFLVIALFGKTDVTAASTLSEKILMAGKSTLFYLEKFLLPLHLSVLYPYGGRIALSNPDFFVPLLILVLVALFLVWSLKKGREAFIWSAFFAVTLAPTFINFAKGGGIYYASDRYAYIPSIGLLMLLGVGIRTFFNFADMHSQACHPESNKRVMVSPSNHDTRPPCSFFDGLRMTQWVQRILPFLAAFLLLAFSFLSARQSLVWKDTGALFENVLRLFPDSPIAHNNLGNAARLAGRLDEAAAHFERALASSTGSTILPTSAAKIWSNLGAVYRKQGKISRAQDAYRSALAADPRSPEAHHGLGLVFEGLGRTGEAAAEYGRAIEAKPSYAAARVNLGNILLAQGQAARAIEEYRTAIRFEPFLADAYYNLAVALQRQGDFAGAEAAYGQAAAIDPQSIAPRLNLASLMLRRGDRDAAIAQLKAVLAIDPGNRTARQALERLNGNL